MRDTENFAKEILEKYIYKDKKLINSDKPDIQSLDGTVGIEHICITTQEAKSQEKMQIELDKKDFNINQALSEKRKNYRTAAFDFIVDKRRKVIGMFSLPQKSLIEMIEKVFSKKYPKINNGGYKAFESYDLFLTLQNDWIKNDVFLKITSLIEEYNEKFEVNYHRIFMLKSYSLLVFEDGTCTEIFFDGKDLTKKWY